MLQVAPPDYKYYQNTILNPIDTKGIALHSGCEVQLKMYPAPVDAGIVFKRVDIAGQNEIQVTYDSVVDTKMCTVVANQFGVSVSTIEHLMAALRGMNIDNVLIEVDGPELPVMDGSSRMFIFLLECAGVLKQNKPRKYLKVLKTVTIEKDGKKALLQPCDQSRFSFEIRYNREVICDQYYDVTLDDGVFKSELSRARTYGFIEDAEKLRSMGLALGASLNNAVVIDGEKILNPEGLRFKDEFVRHKTLDAVGDLYVAGVQILGHYQAICSGHELNNLLLRQLFADESNYVYMTYTQEDLPLVSMPTRAASA